MKRILTFAILLALVVYLGDYLSAKFRIPGNRPVFESMEVQRDFAIYLKDRTIEYTGVTTAQQQCVLSLFPHFGDTPCWYLRRHTRQHVITDPGPSPLWFDLQ